MMNPAQVRKSNLRVFNTILCVRVVDFELREKMPSLLFWLKFWYHDVSGSCERGRKDINENGRKRGERQEERRTHKKINCNHKPSIEYKNKCQNTSPNTKKIEFTEIV